MVGVVTGGGGGGGGGGGIVGSGIGSLHSEDVQHLLICKRLKALSNVNGT